MHNVHVKKSHCLSDGLASACVYTCARASLTSEDKRCRNQFAVDGRAHEHVYIAHRMPPFDLPDRTIRTRPRSRFIHNVWYGGITRGRTHTLRDRDEPGPKSVGEVRQDIYDDNTAVVRNSVFAALGDLLIFFFF
jgi:hypothetical protein